MNLNLNVCLCAGVAAAMLSGCLCRSDETLSAEERAEGFAEIFDGKTLDGWKPEGGSAIYAVEDGAIVGTCVPGTPGNTFLCTEKSFENFVFRGEFKCDSGNSGIQFRSSTRPHASLKHGTLVYGYQCEIRPDGDNCGCIYDEARRGFRYGLVWLDNTPKDRLAAARAAFRAGDWNTVEIQCVGPSIKTWINGVKVSDLFDDCQQRGFLGLQIHALPKTDRKGNPVAPGTCAWRNLRVRELPACPSWKTFFAKSADDLVIPRDAYANFMARVTYRITGDDGKDPATNDELVRKVYDAKGGWNTVATIAVGDRIVNRLNGIEILDIVDPLGEKTGKRGLRLHGGCKNEVRFKDGEVMPVEDWMLPFIAR